jgi:2-polyprenyl-6-hydroxyphenyl methylase/3-demethylubiquinone-9 3-methyltransferase
MKLGPQIRALFGPYERQIAEAYRALYVDIDAFVAQVRKWKPLAGAILEVGCGEGAVTERLSAAYPVADIVAIDITDRIGRLYRGSSRSVRFMRCAVHEIPADVTTQFDLILLSDVLHHVPAEFRQDLLAAIRARLAPRGTFVFKDWRRSRTPIHWLCYASDRWLTGDRVGFMTGEEMRARLARIFGERSLIDETRIGPWSNNIAMLVRP